MSILGSDLPRENAENAKERMLPSMAEVAEMLAAAVRPCVMCIEDDVDRCAACYSRMYLRSGDGV